VLLAPKLGKRQLAEEDVHNGYRPDPTVL